MLKNWFSRVILGIRYMLKVVVAAGYGAFVLSKTSPPMAINTRLSNIYKNTLSDANCVIILAYLPHVLSGLLTSSEASPLFIIRRALGISIKSS
jgi:hypothetical protein